MDEKTMQNPQQFAHMQRPGGMHAQGMQAGMSQGMQGGQVPPGGQPMQAGPQNMPPQGMQGPPQGMQGQQNMPPQGMGNMHPGQSMQGNNMGPVPNMSNPAMGGPNMTAPGGPGMGRPGIQSPGMSGPNMGPAGYNSGMMQGNQNPNMPPSGNMAPGPNMPPGQPMPVGHMGNQAPGMAGQMIRPSSTGPDGQHMSSGSQPPIEGSNYNQSN